MSINEPRQPFRPPESQAADALQVWASEACGQVPATLSVIRLDENEKLVIPFTTTMVRCAVHYLDSPHVQGYVHCLPPTCMLCRLGRQADARDLLPVYEPMAQAIGILAITPNQRPMALRPMLYPILARISSGERLVVGLRKYDAVRHAVSVFELPVDADDGGDQIAEFKRAYEAGEIDLGAVYPRLGGAELAAIPEIARCMTLRGIKLS